MQMCCRDHRPHVRVTHRLCVLTVRFNSTIGVKAGDDWSMAVMIRFCLMLASLCFLAASAISAVAQNGADRRGGDYMRFEVSTGDPRICAARCDREQKCRAWTFSYPATADASAICWLKSEVKAAIPDSCCVSGVKGGSLVEPYNSSFEFAIDRYGGDYRDFELASDPTGKACKAACESDNRCRVWTYVRPGYLGPVSPARCYLKNRITRPLRKPGCISGVVR